MRNKLLNVIGKLSLTTQVTQITEISEIKEYTKSQRTFHCLHRGFRMSKCRGPPFLCSKSKMSKKQEEQRMPDKEKYIYVKGKKVTVSDEVYKAYKKQINHEAHLNRLGKKHKVYGFEDYKIDLNSIADENVDVEKIIETKMMIEDLYQALEKLNDEERKVIESLYFKEMTIRDLAKEQQVSSKKVFSFRNKILKKLREILK